jgi:hypothetical protein
MTIVRHRHLALITLVFLFRNGSKTAKHMQAIAASFVKFAADHSARSLDRISLSSLHQTRQAPNQITTTRSLIWKHRCTYKSSAHQLYASLRYTTYSSYTKF